MAYLPAAVTILAYLFIVVSMLSVPLETTSRESVATLRDCGLMGYALLANLSIIPVLRVILARLFDLPLEMRTGFLRLALAPGGLFTLQCARVSQGNRVVAVRLLVALTLVAIVVTPVLMSLCLPPAQAGQMPCAWLLFLLLLCA
jgi:BASS family bile acid:Na+ symporter